MEINFLKSFIRNPWDVATLFLLTGLAFLVVTTAAQYGESWDEEIRFREGEKKLSYYQHLLSGEFEEAKSIGKRRDKYPGFHDLNLAILRRFSPISDRVTGNMFSAIFGILTIFGTYRLTKQFGNSRTAFFSALLLTTVPAFYGHIFINPKDIPFACGYVWSLYMICAWLIGDGFPSWGEIILTGIAIGITMATRVGGLVLFCYLGLFVLIYQVTRIYLNKGRFTDVLKFSFLRKLAVRFGVVALISMLILLLYWPYGQLAPFSRTGETLEAISAYNWQMPVFFEGQFFKAPDLPFYYILKMFLIKVPIIVLGAAVAGLWYLVNEIKSNRFSLDTESFQKALILFSVVFPLAYVVARDSILYNGIRHLLFILPPLCCIAAIGLDRILNFLKSHRPKLTVPCVGAVSLVLILTVINMVRLHPYQYIYYNELAGGTAQASNRYETDYWCTVYKELGEDFLNYLRSEKPSFTKPEIIVNMEHITWLLTPFIPEDTSLPIHILRSSPEVDDYYISSTSWAADQFYYGEPVINIERIGIPLGQIKDRRKLTIKERELGYSR